MDDTALSLWLKLREQADWAARSATLAQAIAATLPSGRPVSVLDLATGTGSNLRYLIERLPARQAWLLVDRSQALLSDVEDRTQEWAAERGYSVRSDVGGFTITGEHLDCRVEMRAQDLSTPDDPTLFADRHLVTASALLDLVSEPWLRTLASRCREAGAAALFTVTYDGRFACFPPESEDERIRALMNQHQHRDKGLGGPAEGPGAATCAARCLVAGGYRVRTEPSDWVLKPSGAAMQRMLINGWAEAAAEEAPGETAAIRSWQARRLAHVNAGRSHIIVGHHDVAAWPD